MTALFCLTTYQFPHLEHFYYDIRSLSSKGVSVKVIDFVRFSSFRTDLYFSTPREYASRVLRNTRMSARVNKLLKNISSITPIEFYRFDQSPYPPSLSYYDVWRLVKGYFTVVSLDPSPDSKIVEKTTLSIYSSLSNLLDYARDAGSLYRPKTVHIFNGRLPVEYTLTTAFPESTLVWYECNQSNYYPVRLFHPIHDLAAYGYHEVPRILNLFPKELLIECCTTYALSKAGDVNRLGDAGHQYKASFFTSSNDEYAAWYEHPVRQYELLASFLAKAVGSVNLCIRIHPNTIYKSAESKACWDSIVSAVVNLKNVKIVPSQSDENSYLIASNSKLTFSIGSSIGAELLLLGIPHIFVGCQHQYGNIPGVTVITEKEFLHFDFSAHYSDLEGLFPGNQNKVLFDASISAALLSTPDRLLADYSFVHHYQRKPYVELPVELLPIYEYALRNRLCICNSIEDVLERH